MHSSNWFITYPSKQHARLILFCFPYAGGGLSTYANWHKYLPKDVEVVFVQPPGRGSHMFEPAFDNMTDMINALIIQILPRLNRPFIFFGHSLGSRIGFELTKQLEQRYGFSPRHFIASGSRAPHVSGTLENWHLLSDDNFKEQLRELNGTPEEVLNNDELMSLIMPLLRADFRIADEYRAILEPIACPISVLGGTNDSDVSKQDLDEWSKVTSSYFKAHEFEGDHFFIDKNPENVLPIVRDVLVTELAGINETIMS